MKDIALKVGVSKGAVSLVLSGKAGKRVSESTRNKILEAAEELNYQVNEVARSLRTGQSKIISVIVTDISNEFFGKLVFHIQEEAKKQDYLVLTANSNESAREYAQIVRMLAGKKVDGIISVTPPDGRDTLEGIVADRIPVVQFDRCEPGMDIDYVGVDNYDTAYDAVSGLIRDGFRNIALMSLDLAVNPIRERCSAYRNALSDNGLGDSVKEVLVSYGDKEEIDINEAVDELFGDNSTTDAVFFTSRRVFTHVMDHLAERGGGSARKCCLLCFDDVKSYLSSSFEVRYVEQPVEEMATKAFSLLMDKIKGDTHTDRYIFKAEQIKNS